MIENDFDNNENKLDEIEEIGFADRVIGVFTTPMQTLGTISKLPQKVSSWIVPIIIMIIVASLSTVVYNYNPALRAELESKQIEALEKNMDEQVKKGAVSSEEADKKIANLTEQINAYGNMKLVLQIVSIVFVTFFFILIVNGFFFLIIKFGFKGEGNYTAALTGYSSVYYIMILQTILTVILSLASGKFYIGLSLGNFFDVEWMSLTGFVLRKLDPFFIWFYVLLGISYAKMFKSENYGMYIGLTVGCWIVFNTLMYYLSTLSSIFQGFAM